MSENIIEVENLEKSYGQLRAVQGISFAVGRGSLFSFLGVNGAGKSTAINILCTLLKKDAGRVRIAGFDLDAEPEKIRPLLGVVFQHSVLDDLLTVRENLAVRAACCGVRGAAWKKRLSALTELLGLNDILDRPFGKLSGGQRRRADIARGLVNEPQILILDEPTTGLDPQTRRAVWDSVRSLRKETGMTVFLTTHYMEEANGSDRVVILDGGKVAAEGTPVSLKNSYSRSYLHLYGDVAAGLGAEGIPFEQEPAGARVAMESAEAARGFLQKYPALCADFEFVKGDMDDVFLAVTGKQLPEGGAV